MVRHGIAPFLECSSRGEKRLSAFYARIKARGSCSIEEIYQGAKVFEHGVTGLTWREAKGRASVNALEVRALYAALWDEYIAENPELVDIIINASGLSDIFGNPGSACQATELWRIRSDRMVERLATPHAQAIDSLFGPDRTNADHYVAIFAGVVKVADAIGANQNGAEGNDDDDNETESKQSN
jgi:hypothetical protein